VRKALQLVSNPYRRLALGNAQNIFVSPHFANAFVGRRTVKKKVNCQNINYERVRNTFEIG